MRGMVNISMCMYFVVMATVMNQICVVDYSHKQLFQEEAVREGGGGGGRGGGGRRGNLG